MPTRPLSRRRLVRLAPLVLGAGALLGACTAEPEPPATATSAAPSLAATAAASRPTTGGAPLGGTPSPGATGAASPSAPSAATTAAASPAGPSAVTARASATAGPSTAPSGGSATAAAEPPTATPTLIPARPTVTPTPKPVVPTPTPGAPPEALAIPKIAVDAPIKGIGTRPTGEMDAPNSPTDVGWFMGSPMPGEPGNAVLTGHLDWHGPPPRPAVFWRIKELVPGDEIQVRTARGPLRFTIESTTLYDRSSAPVEQILGFAMGKVITIVTCEGTFIPAERDYTQRRVIRARLA